MNTINTAQIAQDTKIKLSKGIKSKIFDILAAIVLIALIGLSLGVLERRVITWSELANIIIECIPFFLAAMLLNNTYYTKGIFLGKTNEVFVNAKNEYSALIDKFTGQQIDSLDEFCQEYNDEVLEKMQTAILKRASISYDRFSNGDYCLKIKSKIELEQLLGKERAKYVLKAKNCKIKGLHVNTLLGTNDTDDLTDIGKNEEQLSKSNKFGAAMNYCFSTLLMSLIAVKNITDWGWFGIALVIFKCVFITAKAYTAYFDGYNDVTISLVNHTNRKIDILKQFEYWYGNKIKNN